jgi:hypothetical protein
MTDSSLHETDILAWADRQVAELRRLAEAGITNDADWAAVIQQIESVGHSERGGATSHSVDAAAHTTAQGAGGPGVPPRIMEASPFTPDDLLDPAFQYEDGRRRLRDIPIRDSGDTL